MSSSPASIAASTDVIEGPPGLFLLRFAADSLAVVAALALAFLLRFSLGILEVSESSPLTVRSHVVAALLWMLGVVGALTVNRLYDEDTLFSGGGEFSRLIRSLVEATSLFAMFVFVTQSFYVSRSWFGLTIVLTGILLLGQRMLIRKIVGERRRRGKWRRPLIPVGVEPGPAATSSEALDFDIQSPLSREDLLTYLSAGSIHRSLPAGASFLLRPRDFDGDELWRLVIEAGDRGHPVFLSSSVRSVHRDRLTVREIGGQTMIKVDPIGFTGARGPLKRVTDLAFGTIFAVLVAPVIIVIAVAILATGGPPVFYRQDRVGLKGKTFSMIKFRTMRPDAEEETGPVWTAPDDDRRTRVGRFLRRFSLDELPQLWNVLRGDMSLVGPRPERPFFADTFDEDLEWYRYRTRTKPGITGLAQCRGLRGNSSLESRVDLDNWYIEHWSVSLDLKIMLKSVAEVLRGENAY